MSSLSALMSSNELTFQCAIHEKWTLLLLFVRAVPALVLLNNQLEGNSSSSSSSSDSKEIEIFEQDHRYKRQLKNERKKKELELVGKGKNPYFLKRAEENKLELIDKYKKINNNKKKLDNIIEKRRKKNASKEIKHLPFKKRRKLDR
ncbi:12042_t:CDS:2 [Entrophospora sp. SA101]|nr:12042_t:CDS:2 [Entrophospora sp. SA101]